MEKHVCCPGIWFDGSLESYIPRDDFLMIQSWAEADCPFWSRPPYLNVVRITTRHRDAFEDETRKALF
jgi:hypothetical protein